MVMLPSHHTLHFQGAIAGAASVYGNTPIDVVKTRMQGLEAKKYKSSVDCAVQIWKKEGFFAFYKGTVPRLSRVCLDVAITFMIYDSIMVGLGGERMYFPFVLPFISGMDQRSVEVGICRVST